MVRYRQVERALAAERARAQARLSFLARALDEIVEYSAVSPPDDEHDPEGATVGWERAQLSALRDEAEQRIHDLDVAERRLEQGIYDRCERCEGVIEPARLIARPATRRCVSCASKG